MRKLALFIALTSMAALTSCTKEEVKPEAPKFYLTYRASATYAAIKVDDYVRKSQVFAFYGSYTYTTEVSDLDSATVGIYSSAANGLNQDVSLMVDLNGIVLVNETFKKVNGIGEEYTLDLKAAKAQWLAAPKKKGGK